MLRYIAFTASVRIDSLIKIRILLHSSLFREAQKTRIEMALVSATHVCVSKI